MKRVLVTLSLGIIFCSVLLMNSCKKDKELASLTTSAVTNITVNSLTSGGSITSDGGAAVTARGVCYGTSANPVISGTHTSDDQGTGDFVCNVTGLTPNTLYHIRAYATNSVGTAYGEEVTATTTPIVAPVLTTTAVTAITLTTAVSGGNITSDGNDPITARGVCWATTASPTIAGSKTSDATGSGTFVSNLTALLPGTVYYVRAYATNSVATSYGNEITFTTTQVGVPTLTTTAISLLAPTSATSGGNITADGGGTITARGVCWATTANPTIAGSKTTDGTGTGVFTSNLTLLTASTQYHVRAYATNSAGTAYGNDITFTTSPVGAATLSTAVVTSITQTTAVSGGTITADGSGSVTARGVCYSTTTGPTIAGSKTSDGTGIGTFTSNLTSLTGGTTYYVRAYATNSAGTSYGNEVSFTTSVGVATVSTTATSAIAQTTATSGGNVTANGGGAVTARGVCYSTAAAPTVAGDKTSDGTGNGIFTSHITGLVAGTLYHVRAYATNSAGTAYGTELTFTTSPVVVPVLTTAPVTAIGLTSAVSGGTITNDGGAPILAKGIAIGTSANPTTLNPSDGTGPDAFVSTASGLTNSTTYYIRAYATNSAGTGYGNQIVFTTSVADNDGNTYRTVTIGSQIWMAENLKTTKLTTEVAIPEVTNDAAWIALSTPAYSMYANDPANKNTNGLLYNWYAIDGSNLCPAGWHVPSDADFKTLELYLGMAPGNALGQVDAYDWRGTNQGTQLKSTTGWQAPYNGTNSIGFNALAGGYRFAGAGDFRGLGKIAYWWTSTETGSGENTAWYRRLDGNSDVTEVLAADNAKVFRHATLKTAGKYVRCLKD